MAYCRRTMRVPIMVVNEPSNGSSAKPLEAFLDMRSTLARFAAIPAAAALFATQLAMPALAAPGQFTLVNATSFPISEVYVGSSESDTWGADIMGGQTLGPQSYGTVTLFNYDGATCMYDVKVLGPEGQKGVMYRFDICNLDTLTFSDN